MTPNPPIKDQLDALDKSNILPEIDSQHYSTQYQVKALFLILAQLQLFNASLTAITISLDKIANNTYTRTAAPSTPLVHYNH